MKSKVVVISGAARGIGYGIARCFAAKGATVVIADSNEADALKAAERHRYIVERFGRFPHRNEALGRESTPEETAFLTEPNSSF